MKNANIFELPIKVQPDGLFTPPVGAWSIDKYKLVGHYCNIFTTAMRNKWDKLAYIDLFSGAGYAEINGETYLGSPLMALSLPTSFDKYIFCEQDPERFAALEARVKRDFANKDVTLINDDSNNAVAQIKSAMPKFSKGQKMLSFCFVDPFGLNIKFETIKQLSLSFFVDFLMLHALHMDANRNLKNYIKDESTIIGDYLGLPNWRDNLKQEQDFVEFLATQYREQMRNVQIKDKGYLCETPWELIRSHAKNLPLYYLAFYSRHPLGENFFEKSQKSASDQFKLDF